MKSGLGMCEEKPVNRPPPTLSPTPPLPSMPLCQNQHLPFGYLETVNSKGPLFVTLFVTAFSYRGGGFLLLSFFLSFFLSSFFFFFFFFFLSFFLSGFSPFFWGGGGGEGGVLVGWLVGWFSFVENNEYYRQKER